MKIDITRAWKDETYRQSLSDTQLSTLPANPAGELNLTDADLQSVSGLGGYSPGYGAGSGYGPGAGSGAGAGYGAPGYGAGYGAPGYGESIFKNQGFGYGGYGYENSCAFFCENPVFSINNIKNVSHSKIDIANFCVNAN